MPKPVFVILGATGNQGGSVVFHFLSESAYSLRVVTRDPFSPKALALAAQGIEVVSGNFDDPSSLDAAFKNASLIFSMTDFWSLMTSDTLRKKADASGISPGFYIRDCEAQQNRNIIDAAARVETLERFIFSSLPNVTELSGGKYRHVYHFDSKSTAGEYGKLTYPGLWAKTSVLYAGLYLENFLGESKALFCPKLKGNTLVAASSQPLTMAKIPWFSVVNDTGSLVAALISSAPGKNLIGVSEWLSLQDIWTILAQTLKKDIEFVDDISSDFGQGDPEIKRDREEMMGFLIEFGFDGGRNDQTFMRPEDLNISVKLQSVRDWIEKQDWSDL